MHDNHFDTDLPDDEHHAHDNAARQRQQDNDMWYYEYIIAIRRAAGPGYDWSLPEW